MTPEIQSFIEEIAFQPEHKDRLTYAESRYLYSGWFEDFVYYTLTTYLKLEDK